MTTKKTASNDDDERRMKAGLLQLAEAMATNGGMAKRSLAKVRALAGLRPKKKPQ